MSTIRRRGSMISNLATDVGATKVFWLMFYAPGSRNFQEFFKLGAVFSAQLPSKSTAFPS